MTRGKAVFWGAVVLLLAVPTAHPSLIPIVGVPSHLLWWVYVLPVAMVTYEKGRRAGVGFVVLCAALVILGERAFGAGYGTAADWATVGSLATALTFTNLLVLGFALYARNNARRYQVLFEASSSGIINTDEELRVEAANPSSLEILRLAWEELEGRHLREVRGLSQLPSVRQLERTGWEGSVCLGPEYVGSEIHLFVVAVSHEDLGGYQILLVDRTAEVAQEREIERQSRLATLGEALAGVAHELNNPLSVISAWVALATDPETGRDEMMEGLEIIGDQTTRMKGLVEELLGYSRPLEDVGRARVDGLVDRLVRLERMVHPRTSLEAEINWRGDVAISPGKLEQILVNLLSNAADAAPVGRGRVRVELEEEGGEVVITVSDNGPGVRREMRDQIFDPFVTTKPEGEGTGLGLPISRRLARAAGGSLTVTESRQGGAAFALRLPPAPVARLPA